MNVIARLEYELAYYDSAVHRFNHYTTRTPPFYSCGGAEYIHIDRSLLLYKDKLKGNIKCCNKPLDVEKCAKTWYVHMRIDWVSSTEFLFLLIWYWLYLSCSFLYTLILSLVFLLLSKDAFVMLSRFSERLLTPRELYIWFLV